MAFRTYSERHLTDEEVRAFTVDLVGALSAAAELGVDNAAEQIIEGRRATARIEAGAAEYRAAKKPVEGDFGPVEIPVTSKRGDRVTVPPPDHQ